MEFLHSGGDGSPEARIGALEKNLASVRDRFTQFERETEGPLSAYASRLDRERAAREQEIGALRTDLGISQTEGIPVAVMGVVCLLFGLVMSTGSIELHNLLLRVG